MQRWFFADDQVVIRNPTPPDSPIVKYKTSSSSLPDTYWKFIVICDRKLCANETLALCGSAPVLGEWNTNHCLPLNRETNSSFWSLTILLPRIDDIYYRYLICAMNSSGQKIVRFWETHEEARIIGHDQVQSSDNENFDIFGLYNNKFKIERGWITSAITVVQFKFYQSPFVLTTSQGQTPLYVKVSSLKVKLPENCEKLIYKRLSTTSNVTSLEELKTDNYLSTEFAFCEVTSLQGTNAEFHKQSNYGTSCDSDNILVFNLILGDFEQTAYLIDLYQFPPKSASDIPPLHFGYQHVFYEELKGSEGTLNLTIMCATKHRPIGTMKCDYLVVRPLLSHDFHMEQYYQRHWNTNKKGLHIGHRGCGKSFWFQNDILRENTIDSFKLASQHGADMVEFDVQLTKDGIPVLYHDFKLCISDQLDIDLENYDIMKLPFTASEFAALKPFAQNTEEGYLTVPLNKLTLDQLKRVKVYEPPKDDLPESPCLEAVKRNRPFTPLQKVLKQINTNVGFFIELKWPQKFTNGSTQEHFIQDFDKNNFVDIILNEVFKTSGSRQIVFSSFDADICTMIKLKQNRYPVLLMIHDTLPLNAKSSYWDPRGSCLTSGIHYTKAMHFLGLHTNCSNILQMAGRVSDIHARDLCLFVWGDTCRHSDTRKYLMTLGVNGIVFDRINHAVEPPDLKRSIFLLDCFKETLENDKDI